MFTEVTSLLPIEILLQTVISQYLSNSYCITLVSDDPLEFNSPQIFSSISVQHSANFTDQLMFLSDLGCSDYIIQTCQPKKFLVALETVTHFANVRRSDRKLIFLVPSNNPSDRRNHLDLFLLKGTNFIANVLLILPSEKKSNDCENFDLITHQFLGVENVDEPKVLDRWNSCFRMFEYNANLFPHDMSNMLGKEVKVACFTYKPYVLLDLDTSLAPTGRDGIEVRIVDEFCRWINCTVVIIKEDVDLWGELYENQTGSGVLGSVVEDRADIAITALYSWYEEFKALDFSAPYVRTAITCVVPAAKLLVSWELPLLPFSWYTWLALVCTFFYASGALFFAQGCLADKAFFSTFGMMITQTQTNSGKSWKIRRVTGWLLITGFVIDNAYSGGLASTFTIPKYEKSIDTIQDLVDKQLEWCANGNAWIYSISLSTEPLVRSLLDLFRLHTDEVLAKKSTDIAYSIEKLPAGYFAVGDYITAEKMRSLQIMAEDFYYEQCVAMLRKNSPYTSKLSDLVGRLHESGLMLCWETQVALKRLNYQVQLEVKLSRTRREIEIKPLSFKQIVGIFIFYAMGVVASIALFILELFVYNHKKKVGVKPEE